MANPANTPNQQIWNKFRSNKLGMAGLCWIILTILLALFAYLIIPDGSPDANEQIPNIALEGPGFEMQFLKTPKQHDISQKGFLTRLVYGQAEANKYIPILHYQIKSDSLFASLYQTGGEAIEQSFPLSALVGFKEKAIEKHIVQRTFWLGTDLYGRDILSRLILGSRISLLVGLIAMCISLTLGIFIGAVAGYFGGRIDDLIMLLINTVWSIPTLLLVFAIVLALGKSIGAIFLAVGLTMWVDVARIVRGQVLSLKEMAYIEAAEGFGFGAMRIIRKHILPNILGPVMVVAAANFAMAILLEAGLSYLGFGVQPPTPSWGTMLNENYGFATTGKPFLALVPALAIMLLVLSFNLVGNALRDGVDVKD